MKNLQYFPFERNQYYYGKLITQQDFISEQKYMNDKRRLINRFLHGVGVVSGLRVVRMDDRSFSLEAGLALDEVGREILVDKPMVVRLDQLEGYQALLEDAGSDIAYLLLSYREEDVYPSRAMAGGNDSGTQVYEKSRESYRLHLSADFREQAAGTLLSLTERTEVLFENEDLLITQHMPAFAQAGGHFEARIRVEGKRAVSDASFQFTENLNCLLADGKDTLTAEWKGSFAAAGDEEWLTFPMEAFSIEEGYGEYTVQPYSLSVRVGSQTSNSRTEIRGRISISSRDPYNEMVDRYFERGMDRILSNSFPGGICLAKLFLVHTGNSLLIDQMETLPFGQRVYTAFLNMGLTGRLLKEVRDLKAEHAAASDSRGSSAGERAGKAASATGVCTISLGIGGKEGEKYFSEEIVHGLGLGKMKVSLSLEDSEFQYFGSEEIFEDMKFRAEMAARVNCERGSFVIGIRLLSSTGRESVRIRWVVERAPEETGGDDKAPHIRIIPDKPELKVMQSRYFRAETENLEGMTLLWEVLTPGGGTISRDGRYTAPDTEGIYEVAAFCQEMPAIRNSVFVIVRE